ncbi:MarR family winged helix-turn-helix transcriptional regulator [Yinghuangia sp. YIM S09857]|uniref:MarR family winged helix-turn-helix transcriptional regulator n=1 Tax=Yinghuangia sp. YIM S09857 TaxID=3436929 RepID=UPI003F53A45E
MTVKDYPAEQLAHQPIGYWAGVAHQAIVAYTVATLRKEQLTQPQWWVVNLIGESPGTWTRASVADQLGMFAEPGLSFDPIYAQLFSRGWIDESPDGMLHLTPAGQLGLARTHARVVRANARIHEGISEQDFLGALAVLRRMIDNTGGDSDVPWWASALDLVGQASPYTMGEPEDG